MSDLSRAAVAAVAFLAGQQRPSGELPLLYATRPDMADARAYEGSVYATAFAALSLHRLRAMPLAEAVFQRACAHLREQRNPDGSWSYEGRQTSRLPPDLDDSAVAAAALACAGDPADLRVFRLLWQNEAAPGGPYYTWAGPINTTASPMAREVDALVNANVLLCGAVHRLELPGAAAYLAGVVEAGGLGSASAYTFGPYLPLYAAARAAAAGAAGLAPSAPRMRGLAAELVAGGGTPHQLACACAALRLLGGGPGLAAGLGALIAAQGPDGGWPLEPAYPGYPPHLDGSAALTAAIALDALA